MIFEQIAIIAYAIFMFIGAFFGFRAGSKISMIAGSVSGVLILIGDLILLRDLHNGYLFLLVVSGLLLVAFVQRLLKTKKMMPSGMLLIVTFLFFGFILFNYLR